MLNSRFARLILSFALFAACVISATPARAQSNASTAKKLTVERIYSAPSLSGTLVHGIEWTPDGKRVTYFERTGTGRNAATDLWAMDAATGQKAILVSAKMLGSLLEPEKEKATQGTGLARATPQDYQWAPDGKAILFVSDSELVWLDLASMTPKQLIKTEADIEDPRLSPDGKWVSYLQNYNLWLAQCRNRRDKTNHRRRQRGNAERQARLGLSRRTPSRHRLLVVSRFQKIAFSK